MRACVRACVRVCVCVLGGGGAFILLNFSFILLLPYVFATDASIKCLLPPPHPTPTPHSPIDPCTVGRRLYITRPNIIGSYIYPPPPPPPPQTHTHRHHHHHLFTDRTSGFKNVLMVSCGEGGGWGRGVCVCVWGGGGSLMLFLVIQSDNSVRSAHYNIPIISFST